MSQLNSFPQPEERHIHLPNRPSLFVSCMDCLSVVRQLYPSYPKLTLMRLELRLLYLLHCHCNCSIPISESDRYLWLQQQLSQCPSPNQDQDPSHNR